MTPTGLVNRVLRRLVTRSAGPVLEYANLRGAGPVEWVSGACMIASRETPPHRSAQ